MRALQSVGRPAPRAQLQRARERGCGAPGAAEVRMRVARAYVYMTVWPCAAASGAVSGLTATSA